MKKNLLIILFSFSIIDGFSQPNPTIGRKDKPIRGYIFAGVNTMFADVNTFNAWSRKLVNSNEINLQTPHFNYIDLGLISRPGISVGINVSGGSGLAIGSIYSGYTIINKSRTLSILNFDLGSFNYQLSGLVPPGYVLSATQQNQKMYLSDQQAFIGLSSNTFFFIHKSKDPFIGLQIKCGYIFTHGSWMYGYDQTTTTNNGNMVGADVFVIVADALTGANATPQPASSNTTQFNGGKVPLPTLCNYFMSIGIIIGLEGRFNSK